MSSAQGDTQNSPYVVLLSGTHVTGKETLAVSLSKSLRTPWLKAEMAQHSATFGARSQAKRGYAFEEVFGRIWLSKVRRVGFLSDGSESDGESDDEPRRTPTGGKFRAAPIRSGPACTALITCFAMLKAERDAIRAALLVQGVKTIWVILQITEETLSGRTLGAEDFEMAEKVMGEKLADIQKPLEDETDVILIDSMREVDALFLEIREGISRQLRTL